MKNFKRILCLALALVLCLGLVSAASAASYDEYADADKVTYAEAMDVLVALGVISGTDAGLEPTAYVTREQAAKMVAYICLGATGAEALSKASSDFEDVESGRWSAGYIAYCASQGIIEGLGDTDGDGLDEYDPTGNVTGYQFVKMLLCAIGYGANGEFSGAYWSVNTSSVGSNVGAFDDCTATNYDAPATREEAMLYAFNILTGAMTVSYSSLFSAYYSGSSPLTAIDEDSEYKYTLGYKVYGLYKSETSTDTFGRPYYVWAIDGDAITDEYYSDVTLTYTTKVTSGALYTALGKSYAGELAAYTIDGVSQSTTGEEITKSDTTNYFGGRGVLTLVYADDDTYDVSIIEINTWLGQINDIDDGVLSIDVYLDSASTELTCEPDDISGFEEDDYVLLTISDDTALDGDSEIESIAPASSVSGSVDSYASSYSTVNGSSYYRAAKYLLDDASAKTDYSSTYTFYLDGYNNIIGAELESENAEELNYVYLSDSYAEGYGALSGEAYVKIALTFMDGTSDVKYSYVKNSGKTSATYYDGDSWELVSGVDGTHNAFEEGFYSYTVSSSGNYTLKAVTTVSDYIDLNEGSAQVDFVDGSGGIYYATSATKLVVVDDGLSYTGYKNFPDVEDLSLEEGYSVLYVLNSSNRLAYIYIIGEANVTESVTFAYYYGYSHSTTDGEYHTLYVNGVAANYLFETGTVSESEGDIVSIETDDDGYSTLSDISNASYDTKTDTVTLVDDGYFATLGGDYFYFGDDDVDCEVYDVSTDGSVKTASLAKGDEVTIVYSGDSAYAVYITD